MTNTPKGHRTPRKSELVNNAQFSPIQSPQVSQVFSNLTNLVGVPRIVKDSCAQLHNAGHDWAVANSKAFHVLSAVANQRMQTLLNPEIELDLEKLEQDFQQIVFYYEIMENQLNKMKAVLSIFKGLCKLEDGVFYNGWTHNMFYAATEIITAAYQSELFAKRAVTTRLSIAHTRHDIMCYLTSWSHECYLSGSKAGFNLECMLHVTGFRNT